MKRHSMYLFIGAMLCAAAPLYAGGAGTTSGTFLKLAGSARNIAMGQTGVVDSGVDAIFSNPAGICGVESSAVSLNHASLMETIHFENLSFVQKISSHTVGMSVNYLSMSPIDKYDNTATAVGSSYQPYDMSLSLLYAREFEGVPAGLAVKGIYSDIDGTTASAVAFDMGVMVHKVIFPENEKLRLGMALQNLGTHMKFNKKAYSLPVNFKFGGSYAVVRNGIVEVDVNKAVDTDFVLNVGSEYALPVTEDTGVAARIGYRSNTEGLGGFAGFSTGFGVLFYGVSIDYAFVPYGDLDNTHRFSLSYVF